MKFKSIIAACFAAAAILSGCVTETDGNGGLSNGETAKLSVSIALPTTTRANDQAANTAESAVNSIDVFVFNSDGIALSTGGWTGAVAADFSAASPYTLNTDITTVSGAARIYVALNLPKDIRSGFTAAGAGYSTERALLSASETIVRMSDSSDTNFNGFCMFSGVETADLKPVTEAATNDYVNSVSLSVDRVVSKVAASMSTTATDYQSQWTGANAPKLTYTVVGFNVYNEANDSYLVLQSTTKSTLNSYSQSKAKDNKSVLSGHPADEAGRSAMDGFYVGENTSGDVGTTTHAMVATTVSVDKAAKWDATNSEVVYEAATYGAGASDVYVLRNNGISYLTNAANKQAIVDNLPGTTTTFTYTKGYVHFRVWLNKNGKNDYSIGRNEFVHVLINGVKALDGTFPGYPGDPANPSKPIDTDDSTETNNPWPEKPSDPVDGEDAALNVEISINKWTYKANSTILE